MSNNNILRTMRQETRNDEKVERERRIFGNPEGRSLLDDIQSIKQEMKQLRESIQDESKARLKDAREMRKISKKSGGDGGKPT